MAKQSNNNELRYTGLTYDSIREQINSYLRSDDRFSNFVDSALYKIILNIFASSTDLTNYYLERTAEEMFLDTAQHLSSVIMNANQIGYIVQRPIGAESSINIKIDGSKLETDIKAKDKLVIPRYTKLTFNSIPFITKYAYVYTFTDLDIQTLESNGSIVISKCYVEDELFETFPSEDIKIIQGEIKEKIIEPGIQANAKFQKYNIDDPSFSNFYGSEDFGNYEEIPNYDNKFLEYEKNVTRVFLIEKENDGEDKEIDKEFHINRRSLTAENYTVENINQVRDYDSNTKIRTCLIKTNKDTSVDLYFGDGNIIEKGADSNQKVIVQYLSVKGSEVNRTGVIGRKINIHSDNDKKINVNNEDISNAVTFTFKSNILGGRNLEDKESIRLNAPSVFQSMDRLVTKNDYIYFLKTIVRPIIIKHATAWGEAEETKLCGVGAIKELFNIIMVSAVGSMYEIKDSSYSAKNFKDIEDCRKKNIFLEGENFNFESSLKTLYNIFIKLEPLTEYSSINSDETSDYDNIKEFLKQIDKRSQASVRNIYVPPYVHEFQLKGDIYFHDFVDLSIEQKNIENEIYKYFENNLGFFKNVPISDLTKIVRNFDSVKFSNLRFEPKEVEGEFNFEIFESFKDKLNDKLSFKIEYQNQFKFFKKSSNEEIIDSKEIEILKREITIRNILNSIQEANLDFDEFKEGLKLFEMVVKEGMIDKEGNISNYSLGNEIPFISININFYYGS